MARLDNKMSYPSGMKEYLSFYGWHFSKKMCEWAVSRMYKTKNGKKELIKTMSKDEVDQLLKIHGFTLENNNGYDHVYVANMCRADFHGSSIIDDRHLAMFVKDYIDDPDAYNGMPFTRFYADCIGSGTAISWEDVI